MEPFKLKSSAPPSGFARGFLLGMVLSLLVGGVVGYAYVKKQAADVRTGWNLLPVVVAAQDLEAGSVVTYDQVSQRQVPEQFVTESVVRPDAANKVLNRTLRILVRQGDPLLWSYFDAAEQPAQPTGTEQPAQTP